LNTLCPRDIRAGEVIFTDVPGAVGPDNNPKPVCLTCYKRLPGLIYRYRSTIFMVHQYIFYKVEQLEKNHHQFARPQQAVSAAVVYKKQINRFALEL
jgi:hypothetical protein